MKEYTTGNTKVDQTGQIRLTGNVTPQIWYRTITRENGKPHLLAIAILSDIVYWYRPAEVRDESRSSDTGKGSGQTCCSAAMTSSRNFLGCQNAT